MIFAIFLSVLLIWSVQLDSGGMLLCLHLVAGGCNFWCCAQRLGWVSEGCTVIGMLMLVQQEQQ